MGKNAKRIAVPCLAAAMAFTGFFLPKTLAVFTDTESYSFLIYPYDGRGEGYLTFDDGATIRGYADDSTCRLEYTFANSSAALIADLLVTFTLPDGTTMQRHLTDIASGAEKSVEVTAALSHAMLEPIAGNDPELPLKYRPVTASDTVKQFKDNPDAAMQNVTVQTHSSTVYVYREGGSNT